MTPFDALAAACADVRHAEEADAVDGVPGRYVAAPASAEEAGAVLRVATEHDLAVVPRGAGTKLAWGRPPERCDVVLDTRRLDRVVEHAAGDLVVRVEAGVPMERLAEVLAAAGQQLALDVPVPGATVGGTLATATSGPRRLLYGTARDLLIGITVVRADGTIAKSGGKVVKNVAGYDLGKLYTGSYGTLGLIVAAAFRLHPLPAARAYVRARVADPDTAAGTVHKLLHAQLVPSAIELDRSAPAGPVDLTVLVEGVAEGVKARAEEARRLMDADAEISETAPAGWGDYPTGPDGTLVKLAAETAALPRVLRAIDDAAAATGLSPAVRGSAGVGVLYLGLPPDAPADAVAGFVTGLRRATADCDGSAVVLHAPTAVRDAVDVWGPVRALALMRRVKERFDPDRLLAPGRFVGGI